VVIVLPVIVLLLVVGLMSGTTDMVVLIPIVVTAGAGAIVFGNVLREGRRPPDRSVPRLPTDHLRRQMFLALRPDRRSVRRQREKDEESE
jgi:hypothetical protein